MKRTLPLASLLMLAACGGGTLDLSLTSDDSGDNALGTVSAAAVAAETTDLTGVKAVNVTVSEVWVHVAEDKADDEAEDSVDGASVAEDSKGWEQVSSEELTFDLIALRNQATKPLGELPVPAGKITQMRLVLEGGAEEASGKVRLAGAVVEQDGTQCDLLVPKSAVKPGVKLSGLFKAMKIEAGGKHTAVLNLKLKESSKLGTATCAYELNPVLKVKKFEASKSE